MGDNFFYIDKLVEYVSNNINKIPDVHDNNDIIVKNFVNNCCKMLNTYNIQIFLSTIYTPLSKNKKLISESFVKLIKFKIIKNLKLTDNVNKIQHVYKNFKEIINKILITEKIMYIAYNNKNKYTEYLYNKLNESNLYNIRIIKQYMCPLFVMPLDNTNIYAILYNQDLNINNNNITLLNVKKIIMPENLFTEKRDMLINKLGQYYIKYFAKKIQTCELNYENVNLINNINLININFNELVNKIAKSIKMCRICNIYDKHVSIIPSSDNICHYCNNIFDEDTFIKFIMHNITLT